MSIRSAVWDRLTHWWRNRSLGTCPECGMDFADARCMARLAEIDDMVVFAADRLLRSTSDEEQAAAKQDLKIAIELRRAEQRGSSS